MDSTLSDAEFEEFRKTNPYATREYAAKLLTVRRKFSHLGVEKLRADERAAEAERERLADVVRRGAK